ncbi:tripartite tricarboxylate transporter substrate binding protein [Arthrobacter citreus]|uniref:tripartite tricarboxylate transporter substrate binding protein n=1 Tax=Arthrobacter citreus TaxID=1670 RepID=UPI0031F7F6B0
MKRLSTRTVIGTAAASMLLALTACGGNVGSGDSSKEYPSGPVTLTVGQAAGGSSDLVARSVADGLGKDLGVAVPVVNKPGANGALATQEVSGKNADGYNLVMLNASLITITPLAVSENEAVDIADLDVLMGLSQDDYVLVASPAAGVKTLDDIINSPVDFTYGTAGVGTGSQLAQSVIFKQAGITGTEVPFDSGNPALTAVLGNQVQLATIQLGEAKPQIDAGKVVPVVVFSSERNTFLPDVPTAVEEGYDVPVAQYRAVAAPKGLPEDVKARLVEGIEAAVEEQQYKDFNEKSLLTPKVISGEEVVTEWTALGEKYRSLTEELDISLSGN